jgi:hypothetical protein
MSPSSEVNDAVGAAARTLEQEAAALRAVIAAPSEKEQAARRLAEIEAQQAATREAETRTAVEKWLLGNRLAVAKLYGQLDEMLERVRANPNERDVKSSNTIWALICERVQWADLVARRLPGVAVPALLALVAPGFRDLKITGLAVEAPGRLLHPAIVAWWSAAVRERAWEAAAAAWVAANAGRLPEDLRTILEAASPVTFVEPTDPSRGNEAAALARIPGELAQAARQ